MQTILPNSISSIQQTARRFAIVDRGRFRIGAMPPTKVGLAQHSARLLLPHMTILPCVTTPPAKKTGTAMTASPLHRASMKNATDFLAGSATITAGGNSTHAPRPPTISSSVVLQPVRLLRINGVFARTQNARNLPLVRNPLRSRDQCSARNSTAPQVIAPLMATREISMDRMEMFFMTRHSTMTLKNSEPVATQQLFEGVFEIEPDCDHDIGSTSS